MATEKELTEAMKEMTLILRQIKAFEEKYSLLLRELDAERSILTEDDRNDAAIEILNKYSNL